MNWSPRRARQKCRCSPPAPRSRSRSPRRKQLAERGIAARVVSVPSLELLLAQPADRQQAIIGNAPVKIAIEAAVRFGWDAVIGHDGGFVGMHGFGASAPAKDLFKHFGITAEAVVEAASKRLNGRVSATGTIEGYDALQR